MKGYNGFLLAGYYDSTTQEEKMVPFFPYVRDEDIIQTSAILIDNTLQKFSERWSVASARSSIDKSSYIFHCKYNNLEEDSSGEQIGSSFLDTDVIYNFYKNGDLEVEGVARLDGIENGFDENRYLYMKTLYLPYAVPTAADLELSYAYGVIEGLSLFVTLDSAPIGNANINPTGSVHEHFVKLSFKEIISKEGAGTPMELAYQTSDEGYAGYDYHTYISKYIPIRFRFWSTWVR